MFDKLDVGTLVVIFLIAIGIGLAAVIRNFVDKKYFTKYVTDDKCIETHLALYKLMEKIQGNQEELRERLPKDYTRVSDYKEDIGELKITIKELRADLKELNEKIDRLLIMRN